MRASDVMTAVPAKVTAATDLATAARRMVSLGVHHLPVVGPDGVLQGLVFDHDVFARGGFLGDLWVVFEDEDEGLPVAQIQHPAAVEVGADDELTVVLRRIASSAQDCALVVDDARHPAGILTEHDVLRVAVELISGSVLADHEASRPVITAMARERAPAAFKRMIAARIRHLPVVDDDGVLVGVVSLRDLLADDAGHRPELHVEDVIRSDQVRTGRPDEALRDLAARMLADHVGCIPLVDEGGRPVAIVTRRDVLGAAVSALESDALFP